MINTVDLEGFQNTSQEDEIIILITSSEYHLLTEASSTEWCNLGMKILTEAYMIIGHEKHSCIHQS